VLESLIFCTSNEFRTIQANRRCSETTFNLLCDMRKLTVDFLEEPTSPIGSHSTPFTAGTDRWSKLPSAYIPGLPTSNDWVYEACRVAPLLYTAAIVQRVHFSECRRNYHDSVSSSWIQAKIHANLVEKLYRALQQCDTFNVWGDIAGVLY
jgi:hypothetical protein